jgi:hypothetical protein
MLLFYCVLKALLAPTLVSGLKHPFNGN